MTSGPSDTTLDLVAAVVHELRSVVEPTITDPNIARTVKMMAELLDYACSEQLFPAEVDPAAEALERDVESGAIRGAALAGLVAAESKRAARDSEIVGGRARTMSAALGGLERAITPQGLASVMARIPNLDAVGVTDVARVAGGYSKDTYFFDAVHPDGGRSPLVLRRDLPFGPAGTTVVDEYGLLVAAYAAGLAVPEPIALETDATLIGTAAIISRRVPGGSGAQPWLVGESRRRSLVENLASEVARLHTADLHEHAPGALPSPVEGVLPHIEQWHERWRAYRTQPSQTLDAAFAWLLANIPPSTGRSSVVHGDLGLHNIMVSEGEITAVLDWEFAHVGDPVEDLGYLRQYVEPLGMWESFLAAYRASGGSPYRSDAARFYEVWRSVRNAVCCATAWHGFVRGEYPALKAAYQGVPLYRRFVAATADRLLPELS